MAVLAPAAHSPPAGSCQRHRQWEPACAAPRAPSTVLTLYEDPEGRHPVSFLGLPLASHPVALHQLCDLKLAPQGPTSNTAAGELGVRVQSVAHEGFRGGLWTLTCLAGFSSASCPASRSLPVLSLSPPLLLLSVFSLRNHPGHRAAAREQQRARGRERASHKRKASERAWRRAWSSGAWEGGGRAQRWGLGGVVGTLGGPAG